MANDHRDASATGFADPPLHPIASSAVRAEEQKAFRRRFADYVRCNWHLILTAGFALIWIVHRALVQSITVDEASTILYWVTPAAPEHWNPNSNNHVLNSALMRLTVWLFGASHLSWRAPALLGGAIYIASAYGFSTLCTQGRVLSWALFVCLVYNPFLMDYLVAARGYALALGFLSLGIYLVARLLLREAVRTEPEILRYAAAASACAGLSFTANFSFAYANAFLLLAAAVWTYRELRDRGTIASVRLAISLTLPAAAIVLMLTGSVLAAWPKDQLIWGAHSLADMWSEMRIPAFAEYTGLNPYLVNPMLAKALTAVRPYLVTAVSLSVIAYAVLYFTNWRSRDPMARTRAMLAGTLTGVAILTLLTHWLQFKLLGILLPFERTSLFFVPLSTAAVGAWFSVPPSNRRERVVRGIGIAALCVVSVHFLGTLRDSFFNEWRGQADVRAAFPVVRDLCRSAGTANAAIDPEYASILNVYRVLDHATDLDEFHDDLDKMPPGRRVYVVPEAKYGDFIKAEGLQIVFHGSTSDMVVAVRRMDAP